MTTHKRSDRAGTAELDPVAVARPGNGPRTPARDRAGTPAPAVAFTAAAGVGMTRPAPQPVAAPSPDTLWRLATRSAILAHQDTAWRDRRYDQLLAEHGWDARPSTEEER